MIRPTAVLVLCSAPLAAQTMLAEHPGKSNALLSVVVGGHDLNFDGVPDLVTGAPYDDTAGDSAGAVYVRSGATGQLLWWRYGATGDNLGTSLAMSPDLNGDGVWDVVVGAPASGPNDEGTVYVLSGLTSAPLRVFAGSSPGDWMGVSVAADFDYDEDGTPDICGGAPYGPSGGKAVLWSGSDGSELTMLYGAGPGTSFFGLIALGGIDTDGDGNNDTVVAGTDKLVSFRGLGKAFTTISGATGLTLGNAGDTDGDGTEEVLAGVPGHDAPYTNAGAVWLVELVTPFDKTLLFEGNAANLFLGNPLAGLGDLDGDGREDWAIGASNGAAGAGHVRVLSAQFQTELYRLTGTPGTSTPNDVAALGDVNGDGFPDLAVADGTYGAANDGIVVVYSAYGPGFVNYCTPGTSASGCQPTLSATGTPAAFQPTPFVLSASGVEGNTPGLFFYGWNGRQANAWGNGTSLQCVAPPVKRAGLLPAQGTSGQCDGSFSQDLNSHWSGNPGKNPGPGTVCQAQLWYRDPFNTSNQTTSMSDAIEFYVDF